MVIFIFGAFSLILIFKCTQLTLRSRTDIKYMHWGTNGTLISMYTLREVLSIFVNIMVELQEF